MELNFTVTNQKIKYVSNLYIVEKSRNYLTAKFSFSGNEWKNVVKTAIFKKDDTVINVLLDESGRCDVPWEVITKGTLKVSVFGGDLVTVDTADVKILKSGYEEGNAPSEPTPDVYSQILAELQDIRSEYVTEEMLGQAVEDWLAENVVEALSPEDVQNIVYGWLEEHKTELKGEKGDSGENGIDGKDGIDGATFTPKIVDGVLSWENNGELDNPTSFDFNEELGINELKEDVETLKTATDITTTTSTTQPNSYAGREMILEIGGVTEQESTAGNQLFDDSAFVTNRILVDGGSYQANGSWGTSDYCSVNSLEVTISQKGTFLFQVLVSSYDVNKNFLSIKSKSGNTSNHVFQLPENTAYIRFSYSIVVDGASVNREKVMLNAGTTALPWEKYTGGQPAPNPSYPMPIKNSKVKGIRTHWKNLLKNNAESKTVSGVTFTVNNDGSITINGTATADINFNVVNTIPKENNLRFKVFTLGGSYSGTINRVAYTSDYKGGTSADLGTAQVLHDKYDYSRFRISVLSGAVCNNLVLGLMVSREEYVNTYEPYTESSYTFSQPIDLYGMDGVQDVITPQPIKRRFAKRIFDGSEGWFLNASDNSFRIIISGFYYRNQDSKNYMCSQLKAITINDRASKNPDNSICINSALYAICKASAFATLDEWKAHLASNPMTVVYELAEEVTEELPIADQIGLNSLATYDGITYVEFIYDELEPTFKGKYGTSEVGGMTLESLLVARNNELRLTAVENAVVNNI